MVLWTPTLALKTFEVFHWIKCTLSPATLDTVLACSVCQYAVLSTFAENPDNGDDIVPFFVMALRIQPLCGQAFATLGASWFQCRFFSKPRVKINLYPPAVMSVFLSLTSKSQWCTIEIDLKLTVLLVHVAWKRRKWSRAWRGVYIAEIFTGDSIN